MDETLATRVAFHAARTPDAQAIVDNENSLTYAELDRLSARIASSLSALAPDPERPVVLLMREGAPLISTMLAAVKANRVFIPLEKRMPGEWLAGVVSDSGASCIVCDQETRNLAEEAASLKVPVFDVQHLASLSIAVAIPEPPTTSSSAPAYVVYTSGTTGKPKGVIVPHRTVMYAPDIRAKLLGITGQDRIANLRSSGTGSGMSNNFQPLLIGACLVPFDMHRFGLHPLATWLNEQEVTAISFSGSLLRAWLDVLPEDFQFSSLRFVIATGEALYGQNVERLRHHLAGNWCILHTLAATEASVIAAHRITASSARENGIVPVGLPVAGTDVRLENDRGEIAGLGECGEIVIRGFHLALGYWKDPVTTAKAFSTGTDGMTVYRTGDLGRFREDGMLEQLGRKDRKLRVRGHSVEPVEIERVLLSLPGVTDAIVVAHQVPPREARLIGYVACGRGGPLPAGAAIRDEVAKRLPAHSVPSQFVALHVFPMTLGGKIDRAALPIPSDRDQKREYRAPMHDSERLLTAIWSKVLGIEKIGIDDDFFELGGTSLQALAIFAELANALGCDLPPASMIPAPTIATQAALAQQTARNFPSPTLVPFREKGSGAPLFVLHGGYGGILFARELAQCLAGDRPVYGLQPPPLDGSRAIPQSVEQSAALYLAEIRKVQPHGPYHFVGHSYGGRVAWEMAQTLKSAGEPVGLLALIDTLYDAPHEVAQERSLSRARRHLSRMSTLFPGALIQYVSTRVAKTFIRRTKMLGSALQHLPNDMRLKFGRPIPYNQRSMYYFRIFSRASRRYRPAPYPGPVLMFSALGLNEWHSKRWAPLALGGLTMHEIPAGHGAMVWPPFSATLARGLDAFLDGSSAQGPSDVRTEVVASA